MTDLPKRFADPKDGKLPAVGDAAKTGSDPQNLCTNHPFVSILVCTVGNRPTLERCLDSLVAQDCQRSEILLVLNSDPNEAFASRFSHYPVRLLQEPRRGVCIARNSAIPKSKGEILVFVDDDIVAHPQWLHELVKGFENPSVACVTGRMIPEGLDYAQVPRRYHVHFGERALTSWVFGPEANWYQKVLDGTVIGCGCNMAFRKSFLEKSSFPEDLGAGSLIGSEDDNYMLLQVLKHGFYICHTPSAIVSHFFDPNQNQQKARLYQLRAGIVAFRLKLLWEENGSRWATLQNMLAGGKQFLRTSLQPETTSRTPELTPVERLHAYWQGIRIFWKSRR